MRLLFQFVTDFYTEIQSMDVAAEEVDSQYARNVTSTTSTATSFQQSLILTLLPVSMVTTWIYV